MRVFALSHNRVVATSMRCRWTRPLKWSWVLTPDFQHGGDVSRLFSYNLEVLAPLFNLAAVEFLEVGLVWHLVAHGADPVHQTPRTLVIHPQMVVDFLAPLVSLLLAHTCFNHCANHKFAAGQSYGPIAPPGRRRATSTLSQGHNQFHPLDNYDEMDDEESGVKL